MSSFRKHFVRFLPPLLIPRLVLASPAHADEPFIMTEHMMFLVLQLGLILFAAKAGGLLFRRLNLPGVLGELMSGISIGPFAFGALRLPGFPLGLFRFLPRAGRSPPNSTRSARWRLLSCCLMRDWKPI